MDSYDFETPSEVTFRVEPGWSALSDSAPASPLVRIRNADVPRYFTMFVTFTEHTQDSVWVAVFFEVEEDKSIRAVAAWAGGRDIQDALRQLTDLRPMAWWERKCLVALAFEIGEEELEASRGTRLGGSDDMDGLRFIWKRIAAAVEVPTGRRNNRVTDDLLERVAETYRSAVESGSPTAAVAREFSVSRAQAARYVARAREAGYLGPARGTTGGEA